MSIHQLPVGKAMACVPRASDIKIKVVETEEERLKAMLVRAIVYMHEQKCPFNEGFDLNDHSATQIVGLDKGGEPLLTARIRFFNGFAKIERLAIRPESRGLGYGHRLLSFIFDIARQKGFSRFYLHAQKRLRPFYEGYGFVPVGDAFSFSDHDYIEMVMDEVARMPQPSLQIGVHPMALNRPENSFFVAGPLERRLDGDLLGALQDEKVAA